ncbi:MAG: dimethylamine corrinoid protein 3 [Deltaproteobacteria bacterium]|nr:MAG: dimethylamine corrinoid protein 3 [Deltaproteobacteria bacterium]
MIPEDVLKEAKQAIVDHDKEKAVRLVEKLIADGEDPLEIMNNGFIPGINEVGDLFGRGMVFLPELVQAADVMKSVTEMVNSALPSRESEECNGSIVIATVKGDVHDIGKCIVVALLQANGYTVYDLGRDVDTDRIIEEALRVKADIIGTSALLTTTMSRQKELEQALKTAGLRDKFKTIVGGAPVTARWAANIGSDAYAEDAQDAVVKVKKLLTS